VLGCGIVGFPAGSLDGVESPAHPITLSTNMSKSRIPIRSGCGQSASLIRTALTRLLKRASFSVCLRDSSGPLRSNILASFGVGFPVSSQQDGEDHHCCDQTKAHSFAIRS
jgi:hypothetical protein